MCECEIFILSQSEVGCFDFFLGTDCKFALTGE